MVTSSRNSNTKTIGEDYHTSESATIDEKIGEDEVSSMPIDNYIMAEFVAVPPDFNLQSHLTMREHVGIYEIKNMNLTQANALIDAIKSSPVFCSMNNVMLNPNICFFVLQLLQELNLIIKSIDNPMRRNMDKDIYMHWAKHWESGRENFLRGQTIKRMNFLVVNVVHLFQEHVYEEALKAMDEVIQFQTEVDSMNFNLDEM
jgi:hypothetical protein